MPSNSVVVMAAFSWRVGLMAIAFSSPVALGQRIVDRSDQPVSHSLGLKTFQVRRNEWPSVPPATITIPIDVNGTVGDLVLRRHSIRGPGFRVLARDGADHIVDVAPPPVATYRGTFDAHPGSFATASVTARGLRARIHLGATTWNIQPAADAAPDPDPHTHILYRQDDVLPGAGRCDCGDSDAVQVLGAWPRLGVQSGSYCRKIARIAFDSDFEFFQQNGLSVSATVHDIESILNDVDAIFQRDARIAYELTAIIVQTAEPDPYTQTDRHALLNEFLAHWAAHHSAESPDPIIRDVAQLMTGKNLDGSIVGVAGPLVCEGMSLAQSRFSNNFALRVALTAHELGHNWSAAHCSGQPDCNIMCPIIGSCSGDVSRFGTVNIANITARRDAVTCLGELPNPPGLSVDCNGNCMDDSEDLSFETSFDCNGNDVPDECEDDCNRNGLDDACDISGGESEDCNENGAPDECDLLYETSFDCNENGIPDECDGLRSSDCNHNGIPDECEIEDRTASDCNKDDVPDECEISEGTSPDCNANGIPDECDVPELFDCNSNGIPDDCDAIAGALPDCNQDGVPDGCKEEGFVVALSNATGGERFGTSAAIDADTAIVGAAFGRDHGVEGGSAHLYRRTGSAWVLSATLGAADLADADLFGLSVGISGATAIVGAAFHNESGEDSGAAYAYRQVDRQWSPFKIVASDGAAGDQFGRSVGVSGDVAIVGAWADDDHSTNSGSAYLFRFDGSTWGREQKLTASDAAFGDNFGWSVAIDKDVAVIGAPSNNDNGFRSGAAYVFRFNGSEWAEEAKLLPSDGGFFDRFGNAVTAGGDSVVIGADNDGNTQTGKRDGPGSAYVFSWTGVAWIQKAKLVAPDGMLGDRFGASLSISGGLVVVGADQANRENGPGKAYAYRYRDTSWHFESTLRASKASAHLDSQGARTADRFGGAASLSGDSAVLGAAQFRPMGDGVSSGAAFFFELPPSDCNGNEIPDECAPGDVDGDGLVDILDFADFSRCLTGVCKSGSCSWESVSAPCCILADLDADRDVDLKDLAMLLRLFRER